MTRVVRIRNFITPEGHDGTDLWIEHEGQRYYSRVNYRLTDSPGMHSYYVQEFHKRRKRYATLN